RAAGSSRGCAPPSSCRRRWGRAARTPFPPARSDRCPPAPRPCRSAWSVPPPRSPDRPCAASCHGSLPTSNVDERKPFLYTAVMAPAGTKREIAGEVWSELLRLTRGQRDRFLRISAELGLSPGDTRTLLSLD